MLSGRTSTWNYNRVRVFLIILEFTYKHTVSSPNMANVRHKTRHPSMKQPREAQFPGLCAARGLGGASHLLHVSQHVLPAVEHAFALLRVQLVDEVGGVVLTTALVPETQGARAQAAPPTATPASFHRLFYKGQRPR